ncbi:MAG: thiamine pyrophosphate-dependent enzyme [Bacteroidia bacterium]|jgi:pyruvate/2-oxoglutarate/acetoin dehydrogenase E1 component/TPP-dependent pyruvate/acetoin dehydrogenase alpha subunit|nr:thiamine pyrophosphate-dependent enzyme [Bacteroidia bacterium]
MGNQGSEAKTSKLSFEEFKSAVLNDYRLVNESRQASLLGRKEVLTGKAKFGIFGDGKEVAQVALSKVFKNGDFRSGYYRDQTFMMAIGAITLQQWFAGLYGDTDLELEPMSGGRQMGGHFATHSLDEHGAFKKLVNQKNSSSDISPTAGQMPRLLGLAYASHFYRINSDLQQPPFTNFSHQGNEVAFGTIGDASTSEGLFWESINAAGVLQVPMLVSVWDDGHGISVPKKYQTTKESISDVLKGFQRDKEGKGFEIFKTKGWDYAHLCETYEKAAKICRDEHVPVLVHVEEVTQPQGHSTSGSHERYKSKERLQWEIDFDCVKKMREWILTNALANEGELQAIEEAAKEAVKEAKIQAWETYLHPIKQEIATVTALFENIGGDEVLAKAKELQSIKEPLRRDIHVAVKHVLRHTYHNQTEPRQELLNWLKQEKEINRERYGSHLYSQSQNRLALVTAHEIDYSEDKLVDGREIIRDNFDAVLKKYPNVMIFGEDSGKIGGVNQGLEGLQAKYGEHRVFDTGIREATIMGQAIGLAMRGLRPIAEIQYLDYLLYALQLMSDDLATVQWRSKGRQKAPVIIRTRGHRLEGVWHSGSPMGMIVHACRGINVCVPRNMTVASGFYNTLLEADEPALVIEPLNAYRLKERKPSNFGNYKIMLGVPEILNHGTQVTLVTYGSSVRIAQDAIKQLEICGISVELIDLQTLLPFDTGHSIVESVKKTSRLVVLDEDVPGGASAYILQKILEEQGAYRFLDSAPLTISAREHRPAYGSDGDYFSKPSADEVFEKVYHMMHESNPELYPDMY